MEQYGWMDGGQRGDETYHSLRELEFLTTYCLPLNGFEIYEHELKIDYHCSRSYNHAIKETKW